MINFGYITFSIRVRLWHVKNVPRRGNVMRYLLLHYNIFGRLNVNKILDLVNLNR